jgi:hypothetical protein
MDRPRWVLRSIAAITLAAAVASAAGATGASARVTSTSPRHDTFKPRVGHVLGIVPRFGLPELVSGQNEPVVYHGGDVMRNVTVHTIFWVPAGYRFDGPPTSGTLGYESLIKQFLVDVAHDSARPQNVFSTLAQYDDAHGPGSSSIAYNPAIDSVDLAAPYPPRRRQCASPAGVPTCVTDLQLQQQIERVIGPGDAGGRGLHDIWFVFLPPDVDTCYQPGQCASTVFAGYHSEFDLGHGPTVYVAVPDPLVELTPGPGSDPQGNPEAEATLQTVGHETEEAITDPYGTGWMDPNGFEVADKCESAPEQGTPLGFALDGSPYNQVIDGRQYLIQDMWSNVAGGCVQASTATTSALPLHTIVLRQYSPFVSGSLGVARRVRVGVALLRASTIVATAITSTRADGGWGPVQLRSSGGAPHGVGDDREGIAVVYGGGAGAPKPDLIATGDGGNPFTESGYTGWFDLDHGYAVGVHGVLLGPCGQTGVLSLRLGTRFTEPPAQLCSSEAGAALIPTPRIGPATRLQMSSEDNRAESQFAPNGALVKLTVSLGEPHSAPAVGNPQLPFEPTGFPQCSALLRIRAVRCTGLVPHTRYALARHRARASDGGSILVAGLRLRGGEAVTLVNGAGRRLTTLHVAHLRVHITGDQTQITSGTCQAGDYYGPPLAHPPISDQVGDGVLGNGTICPLSGRAVGLSTADIAQTDDLSGGQTVTQVPLIKSTAPIQDETLYGPFVASAQSGLQGPHGSFVASGTPIALAIAPAGSRRVVFAASNVNTPGGVAVRALAPGGYVARWVLRDANGDTRTVTSRFVDEP